MTFTTPYFRNIQLKGQPKRVAVAAGRTFKVVGRRKQYIQLSEGEMSKDVYEQYYTPPKPVEAEEPIKPAEGEKED